MLLIVSFFKVPGEDNTKNIFNRIVNIIDQDIIQRLKQAFPMSRKSPELKAHAYFRIYDILYSSYHGNVHHSFTRSFPHQLQSHQYERVCVLCEYRQPSSPTASVRFVYLYRLEEKEGVLTPIIDFPTCRSSPWENSFSGGLARLHFLIFVFDFRIEAPFKLIFEVVEDMDFVLYGNEKTRLFYLQNQLNPPGFRPSTVVLR